MIDLLAVRGLELHFETERGPVQVLDRVNLSIGHGQVVGLVGESGCGKTTLARAILGILPLSARVLGGEILLDGVDLLRMPASVLDASIRGRRITFVPQDPFGSFNPVFTIGAQIMELLKWKSAGLAGTGDDGARAGWMPGLLRPYPRRRYRADRQAVIDLRSADSNVEAVAKLVGYRSPKNFYAALKSETGLTPSEARNLTEAQLRRLLDMELGIIGTGTGIPTPVPWLRTPTPHH